MAFLELLPMADIPGLEQTRDPTNDRKEAAALTLPDRTLTEQGRAVVAAVAAGELAPGQGASLLASLGTLAKLTETDELEWRIAQLEQRQAESLNEKGIS